MNLSHKDQLQAILPVIIRSSSLHAKWLNTLSYLENCGARKIAACEHPTKVKEEILKHASEEFRHAHYLKRQIKKVAPPLHDYHSQAILGGFTTLHYLNALNLKTCRYLSQTINLPPESLGEAAYLLVTFAIELRAEELYPLYDAELRKQHSSVAVKSILLEEKEHLHEMRTELTTLPQGDTHAHVVCALESELCEKWLRAIALSIENQSRSETFGFLW